MNSEVTKYLVAGSLAFSSDITVLYLCTDHLGLHYLVSNILGYSTGVLVAYLLNVNWVFSERIYSNRQLEFLLFNLIVFSGLLISELTMSLMVELAGIGYLAAKVFSSGFVMVSNYVGKKVFLFHAPELATTSLQKNNVRCSNCGLNTASYHSTAQAFDAGGDAASSTFDLTKCTNCALLSTSMDSGQDITRFYPKSYYGDGTDKFVSVIERFLRLAASIRARRITQVWDHSTKDTSGAPRVITSLWVSLKRIDFHSKMPVHNCTSHGCRDRTAAAAIFDNHSDGYLGVFKWRECDKQRVIAETFR
jgi:putative flippase GtrA